MHGPDLTLDEVPCKADAALAHGFSAGLLRRLPALGAGDLRDVDDAPALGRAVLMSTALLLSTREGSWSTDRRRAIDLLGRHAPHHVADAEAVFDWADSRGRRFGSDSAGSTTRLVRLAAWLRAEWAHAGGPGPDRTGTPP